MYVVIDIGVNADGTIYALASPNGEGLDIVTIDPTTGAVKVVHAGLPTFFPRFCESGLSFSGPDPRLYFTADTNTTDPDDGDQALYTYDLLSRSIVSTVPWSYSNGSLNALLAYTLHGAANESVLAIATDPEEGGTRPLELLSISPATGAFNVLGAAATPPGTEGPLIPSLGSLTVSDAGVVTTILLDDSSDQYYLAEWNVSAGKQPFPVTLTPVDTDRTAGGVWSVEWVPASRQ